MTDWVLGDYALDANGRLWQAYGYSFGVLMWRGLGWAGDETAEALEQSCGPLRKVQIVEVRG